MINFELHTKLDDETPVLIRPLRPEDKDSIMEGFERISLHSRYLRYSSSSARLTPEDLEILTCQDEKKYFALGACDLSRPGLYGIGIARYVMCDDEPNTAEIAVVVVDEYQGRGLGSLLLDLLITIARKNGIHSLRGYVLTENRAMIRLLKRVNGTFRQLDYSTFRIDISLVGETRVKKAS